MRYLLYAHEGYFWSCIFLRLLRTVHIGALWKLYKGRCVLSAKFFGECKNCSSVSVANWCLLCLCNCKMHKGSSIVLMFCKLTPFVFCDVTTLRRYFSVSSVQVYTQTSILSTCGQYCNRCNSQKMLLVQEPELCFVLVEMSSAIIVLEQGEFFGILSIFPVWWSRLKPNEEQIVSVKELQHSVLHKVFTSSINIVVLTCGPFYEYQTGDKGSCTFFCRSTERWW